MNFKKNEYMCIGGQPQNLTQDNEKTVWECQEYIYLGSTTDISLGYNAI